MFCFTSFDYMIWYTAQEYSSIHDNYYVPCLNSMKTFFLSLITNFYRLDRDSLLNVYTFYYPSAQRVPTI